jgi:carboxyl-terminal processing protease
MSYDPHTTYMSPTSWKNFLIALSLNLDGIGAELRDQDGQTVVARVVPGGAADKHGKLHKDDVIVSVGQGDEGELEDIEGLKLNDVVDKIRGPAGTTVRLGVMPAGEKEVAVYKIVRAKIQLEDSAAHGEVFEVGSQPNPLKIGVIDLPSFYLDMEGRRQQRANYRSATRDVRLILQNFQAQGVDAVVLDLRQNGGGSLEEAIEMTGLFIDQGPVVQVVDPVKGTIRHNDVEPGMAWNGPLVVLTSKLSASASEILAGAIQDYHRGLVVGDRSTHGKGTVQSPMDLAERLRIPLLSNMGVLKLTIQQFFRPNGESTQQRGVLSDITLPSITDHMDIGEADLDYALEFKRIAPSNFTRHNLVEGKLIAQLRASSTERVSQNKEFGELLERIERFEARKERKSISLNEKKFFEDGEDSDKEEEERLAEEIRGEQDAPKIRRDFFLDEVLAITRDYVEALRDSKFARVN